MEKKRGFKNAFEENNFKHDRMGFDCFDRGFYDSLFNSQRKKSRAGISGAQQDQMEKAQQDKEMEKLRADLGEDAFNGLVALTKCKHEVALGYARTAAKSDNKDYALAGMWIEILTYADNRQEDKARALYPDLINKDNEIVSESQAEEKMRKALQRLMDIRGEHNLPKTCG
jgi:hypothetical protein